ncbi:MAG: M14 family metallopeptidase [Burkholderiales bacterium]|nr:M14 family metallopeptidase [Burkholderiales bacterium]
MNDTAEIFAESYAEARQRFLRAAQSAGAAIESFEHPSARGPDGERLFIDCARLGPQDAPAVLLAGSGTHGIEGFAGSALQTAWLSGRAGAALPPGTAVVFSHGHNPWGFAHRSRVTEDNVDLNRNFVAHDAAYPANPGYNELHPALCPDLWDETRVAAAFATLERFRAEHGEQAFSDAFNGGQYSHADGLCFGGHAPSWSSAMLRSLFQRTCAGAARAAYIDFHTGIGPRGGHIFLCFHAAGSAAFERARAWWGERAVNREGVTHKAVAHYRGLLVDAFCEAAPSGVETTATVVEFGTLPRPQMQRALIAGRWLRYHGRAEPALAAQVQAEYDQAFVPADPAWRRGVIEQSQPIIERALAGLAAGA